MGDGTVGSGEEQPHVLVINDTPEILAIFRELLEDEGYRVSLDNFSSLDLGRLLAHVKELTPDAVVLDLLVGGEQIGWQLLELMKLDPATKRIPIVLCTAAIQQLEELGQHMRSMGIESVPKPFDIDDVSAALARALDYAGRRECEDTRPDSESHGQ
jgi:CheY-like chemotaxis protein